MESKLPELSELSRVFLFQISGLLQSKQAIDATAEVVLPRKWMEQHPSFMEEDKMIQRNVRGNKFCDLDELFKVAKLAKPKFDLLLRGMVQACGLNPDEEIMIDNRPLMMDETTRFKVLCCADLKSKERCLEKVRNDYKGDCARLVDVVRCSIVVFTEAQLELVVTRFLLPRGCYVGYRVVRLKNRFKHPPFNGYRDALYSIVIECGDGITHVCEVQLHLAAIVDHKANSHKFYEYFRSYFHGSGAEDARMEVLMKIGGFRGNPDQMLTSVIGGSDISQLKLVGDLLDLMGEVKVAVLVRKRLLELEDSLAMKLDYARSLLESGNLAEAEVMYREVLTACRQQLGNSHPDTFASINNLAILLKAQGKLAEAEVMFREVLTGRRRQLGDSHPDTLASMNHLGLLLKGQGKFAVAEVIFWEALIGFRQQLGNSHPDTLASMNNLAILLQAQGKRAVAEAMFQEVLTGRRRQLGNSHPHTLAAINNLATLLRDQGKLVEAEVMYREALAGNRQQLGNSHLDTLTSMNNLGLLLHARGKLGEAEVMYREVLIGRRQQLGNFHPDTLTSLNNLAALLQDAGKRAEAEELYREVTGDRLMSILILWEHCSRLKASLQRWR